MLSDKHIAATKYLSRIDLGGDALKTHWCRVSCARIDHSYNKKLQRHSFFELHLCISGRCTFTLNGKRVVLNENTFLLVAPQTEHQIIDLTDDFEKLVWAFSVEAGESSDLLSEKCRSTDFPMDCDSEMLHSIMRILSEGSRSSDCSTVIVNNELYYIYLSICRALSAIPRTCTHKLKAGVRGEAVKKFISDNLAVNPTVSDISAEFYLSERQLERICLSEYGMSVGELKRKLQVELIRSLLADTTMSMQEIARLSGFSDRYCMSKFFSKAEGMSPGKYRSSILE